MLNFLRPRLFVGIVVYWWCSLASCEANVSHKVEIFNEKSAAFARSHSTAKQKANLIDALYKKSFGTNVDAIADDDLAAVFKAAQETLFYTLNRQNLSILEQIFHRMVAARIARSPDYEAMMQAYFSVRDFKNANAFLKRYNKNSSRRLPIHINDLTKRSSRRTAWLFEEKRSLTRHDLKLTKGVNLIVIGSPYCHFATGALLALENDHDLAPLLKGRVTLLGTQDFSFDYDTYAEWNRVHPSLPFVLAHSRDEWPEVSDWTLPTFLFFRNGKLQSQFTGWRENDDMGKVYRGLGISYPIKHASNNHPAYDIAVSSKPSSGKVECRTCTATH